MDFLFWSGIITYLAALVCGFASLECHAKGLTLEGYAYLARCFLYGVAGLLIHYGWWMTSGAAAAH